jgi:hypothetical protein
MSVIYRYNIRLIFNWNVWQNIERRHLNFRRTSLPRGWCPEILGFIAPCIFTLFFLKCNISDMS